MSTCRVVSCVVGRGCLLWPSVFSWQNSIRLCPVSFCIPRPNLPVTPGVSLFPTFLCIPVPYNEKNIFFWVLAPIHPKIHYCSLHWTSKRRDPAPHTRTQIQVPLARKPWQATNPTPSTGSKLHNKEKPWTSSLQKGHPKHSNLNKMKRQRNIWQVKKHDKCPPNQTKEEKIGSIPEKEFRTW